MPRSTRNSPITALCVLCAGLAVGACSAVSSGASIVSLMATKRTLMDHVASFATGQDCSTIALERDQPYCVDPNALPPAIPVYHCYRSLGEITCYETEDPFDNGHRQVE